VNVAPALGLLNWNVALDAPVVLAGVAVTSVCG
jgi:hypothetical protein